MSRYQRQTALPEIGPAGQAALRKARVLIVGVGGLGSPIALYLTAAGVGRLGLVDDDCVSLSNLQRQILYSESEIGQPKALCAAGRLRKLNSEIDVVPYPVRLSADNVAELISGYDIVVDGCDNFATRYVLSDACAAARKPYVYGAIEGFEGQVSVLCCGESFKTYCDIYPEVPAAYSSGGDAVVGITPAVVGSVQAGEVMKLVCGYGETLCGKLWTIDLRTLQSHIIDL